jgi:hypothetical protein
MTFTEVCKKEMQGEEANKHRTYKGAKFSVVVCFLSKNEYCFGS